MLHQGQKTRGTNFGRWRFGRGLFRGRGASVARRTFEEDLALFERQVREEAWEGAGRPGGQCSTAAPSA